MQNRSKKCQLFIRHIRSKAILSRAKLYQPLTDRYELTAALSRLTRVK